MSVASSMRVWIVATFASRDLDLLAGGLQLGLLLGVGPPWWSPASSCGRRTPAASRRAPRPGFRERSSSISASSISLLRLTMAALATASCSCAAATCCVGLGQLGVQRDGVHLHQHLARLDQIALVDEDLLDPQRLLGGDIDQLALDPAVARRDPLRQRGSASPSSSGYPKNATTATASGRDGHPIFSTATASDDAILASGVTLPVLLGPGLGGGSGLGSVSGAAAAVRQHVAPVGSLLHLALGRAPARPAGPGAPPSRRPAPCRGRSGSSRRGRAACWPGCSAAGQERALRVEHALVVHRAFAVLHQRQLHRPLAAAVTAFCSKTIASWRSRKPVSASSTSWAALSTVSR